MIAFVTDPGLEPRETRGTRRGSFPVTFSKA